MGRPSPTPIRQGQTTHYEYDALGRLTAVVDALGQRTEYGYDEAGDLVTQKDANGHVTRYEYDGLRPPHRHRAASGPAFHHRLRRRRRDGRARRTSTAIRSPSTYDPRNRLLAKHYPDGTSVTFTYTPTGAAGHGRPILAV